MQTLRGETKMAARSEMRSLRIEWRETSLFLPTSQLKFKISPLLTPKYKEGLVPKLRLREKLLPQRPP